MQQMLAGIAHEVRNPLAGMTLFAGILQDELPEGDERRGHVDKIQRELGYLERVVNDFLEYARRPRPELATGRRSPSCSPRSRSSRAPSDIAVARRAERARRAAPIAAQLRRALLNLARNAVQAATAAGHRGAGAVKLVGAPRATTSSRLDGVEPRQGDLAGDLAASCSSRSSRRARRAPASASRSCARSPSTTAAASTSTSADGETTFTIVLPG